MSSGGAKVTHAQSNAVAELMRGKRHVWIRIDGPIADTGCIRVVWRWAINGADSPTIYVRGCTYLDGKGQAVRWDSLRDRPRKTPSGKLVLA